MAFSYKRSITFDHTKVPNTDQSNFPALVYLSDATLKTVANGGHVQSASGYDICFFSDSGMTSSLYWEMESYDASNGIMWAWVKIPTLSHTSDTVIYVGYGNAAISTFQSTAASAWDSNYKGVWHLGSVTGGGLNDSTSNGKNGTNHSSTATTGKISGGIAVSGSAQYVDVGAIETGTGAFTLSCWVKVSAFPGTGVEAQLIGKGFDGTSEPYFLDLVGTSLRCGSYAPGQTLWASDWSTGIWYYAVGVWSGSEFIVYSNGAQKNSNAGTGPIPTSANSTYIGALDVNGVTGRYLNGAIDEVRISNSARTADWISTEYANQNSPGTFFTLGAETVVPNWMTRGYRWNRATDSSGVM